ncbi:uncharacterized protein LOC134829875 [Culicoides brevitarsis]|uniref:uncharacterized protein LOC134829875 n=1 Tax=Culicoides brevitarsis TaxID=469753 RepID=UPI00307B178E
MNLKIFLIFFCLEQVSSGVESYRFLKIYDRDICPNADLMSSIPFKPLKEFLDPSKKLKLENGKDSAVVVEQKLGPKSFHRSFQLNCVFKIDASKKNKGLFIVIRRLNFRKKNFNECRDYIRVEFGNKTKSEKICGNVGRNEAPIALIDGTAKVKVEINIDTETPLKQHEEDLDFSIVFTGFSSCTRERRSCFLPPTKDPSHLIDLDNDDNSKSESEEDLTHEEYCISEHFWRDNIVNCPQNCLDEGGCVEPEIEPLLQPSTIFVSAITSLVFTMVIFGTCLWFCFKCKDCSSDVRRRDAQNVRQRARANNRAPTDIDLETPDSSRNLNGGPMIRPSAPEKQDLPPSYDDLFPSESHDR